MKITIDAGHGGHDPGAVGPNDTKEKDTALMDAHNLASMLTDDGHEVMMTRTDDTFVGLAERAAMANDWGADLFISIHCNSFSEPSAHGFEAFTFGSYSGANPIAMAMLDQYAEAFPHLTNRGLKHARFAVLSQTRMAAVLFESAFISNPDEERWLDNPDNSEARANAWRLAINTYYGIESATTTNPVTTANEATTGDAVEKDCFDEMAEQAGVFAGKALAAERDCFDEMAEQLEAIAERLRMNR